MLVKRSCASLFFYVPTQNCRRAQYSKIFHMDSEQSTSKGAGGVGIRL